MIRQLLIRFSKWVTDHVAYVPLAYIKWGFIIQMLMQGLFLIAGIGVSLLTDGWGYVVIVFIQAGLTIVSGWVLLNLLDKNLRTHYPTEYQAIYSDAGYFEIIQAARRRGDRETILCLRLRIVPMFTTFAVALILGLLAGG